jgi:large subunit ribosomal protein L18e
VLLAPTGNIFGFSSSILINILLIGTNTLLLRGPKDREAKKHFGAAPGVPGSHTKPYVSHKGNNHERSTAWL